MKVADAFVMDALISEILTPERLAQVAKRAVKMARTERETPHTRIRVERHLANCRLALERLTAAVAEGGDVPTLVEAIKVQDRRRSELEASLDSLNSPTLAFDAHMEQQLYEAVDDWRGVLGRQVAQARQIAGKLLAGKLTFVPMDRDGQRGFRFEATGTAEKLITGVVPGLSQAVVSLTTPSWNQIKKWLKGLDLLRYASRDDLLQQPVTSC